MARGFEELVGQRLGERYRVERLLGRGGMGAVYEAVQEDLGRHVALKVLHPFLGSDREHLKRFQREAMAAASLGHPNVVQVTDFHLEPDGLAFLVMELIDGRSLHQIIRDEGPLDAARASRIVEQVLGALEAAHGAGIVHRDLKPGNILVAPVPGVGELAKLADFGIVKMMEGGGYTRLTQTGAVLGTPSYMAPEQATGVGIDARSDLYAVGVILYACLTRRLPFEGSSPGEVLPRVLSEPPPPLTAARPDLPPALGAVIERALRKDKRERFASAPEMAAALRSAVPGRGGTLGVTGTPFASSPGDRSPELPALRADPAGATAATRAERPLASGGPSSTGGAPAAFVPPPFGPADRDTTVPNRPRRGALVLGLALAAVLLAAAGAAAALFLAGPWRPLGDAAPPPPPPPPRAGSLPRAPPPTSPPVDAPPIPTGEEPAPAPAPAAAASPGPSPRTAETAPTDPRRPRFTGGAEHAAERARDPLAAEPTAPRPPPPTPRRAVSMVVELRQLLPHTREEPGRTETARLVERVVDQIRTCYAPHAASHHDTSWYEEWMVRVNPDGTVDDVNLGGSAGPGGSRCAEGAILRTRWPAHEYTGTAQLTIRLRWQIQRLGGAAGD